MKHSRLIILGTLVLLVFGLAVLPALGRMNEEEKSRNIDIIIEKSGVSAQLAGIPAMVEQQTMATAGANVGRLSEIIRENFVVEEIVAEVKLVFLREFNESHTKAILKFLDSDLAARMARYEIESMGPAFAEKQQNFDINKYPEKRRLIITKFFKEIKAQNFYYVLQSSIMESMLRALNALLPEEAQVSSAQISKIKKQIKKQIESDEFRELLISEYFLIYEKASDAEMVEYTRFNAGTAGRWMNRCIEKGIVNGLKKCTEKMIIAVIGLAQSNQDDEAAEESDENIQNAF